MPIVQALAFSAHNLVPRDGTTDMRCEYYIIIIIIIIIIIPAVSMVFP